MLTSSRHIFAGCSLSLLLAAGNGAYAADNWLNAGLLYDDFALTLSTGHRTEALGPLFYFEQKESQKTWAVPPLFSWVVDPGTESAELDIVYPLLSLDRYGTEYRWHLFQVLNLVGSQNQQQENTRRFTLFPIYFQQRSDDPSQNYTAVFPLYGHLSNRLFRDEIFFVLFPIYGQSRKRDVVTDNYLYPFFHLRHGDGLKGWQFWPLYGREHKDITTQTNRFGDLEVRGGHDSVFVLWPFYLRKTSDIGTANPQRQEAMIPFYSTMRSPNRDVTTVGWPFFSHITDREKQYSEWQTPWPLIEFARGEGRTVSRVWPFYSHAQNTNVESAFVLWPIYKFNRLHSTAVERERTRILFFLYSDMILKNVETGAAQRRVDFWPLFTHRRDFDGSTRLQMLSILEPLLPNNKSIERNYSPIYAFWRAEKNAKSGAASQSLLWNLYRRETAPESKKCSLLFGLFQYESGSQGKRLRLFYIPVVKTRPAVNAGPQ